MGRGAQGDLYSKKSGALGRKYGKGLRDTYIKIWGFRVVKGQVWGRRFKTQPKMGVKSSKRKSGEGGLKPNPKWGVKSSKRKSWEGGLKSNSKMGVRSQ